MQKSPPAILNYNSLLDEHLAEYYSSPQRKRHLRRMGLITRDGRLVDERTFQRRAVQRDYRRRYKNDVTTNAAVAVSEKEKQQKAELKKKLEALAKYETVQRIKMERLHPPGIQTYNPEKALKLCSESATPALSKTTPALSSLSDTYLSGAIEKHKDRVSFTPEELGELKHLVKTIAGPSVAGPTIVQAKVRSRPLSTTKRRASAASKKGSGYRRPSTAPTKPPKRKSAGKATEKLVQEKEGVTMTLSYLGTTEALKNKRPLTDVEVWQQPQGFTPIRVFKGFTRPGDTFSFQSIRQPGMPFALVIYTGGMIDCRVSVCCEYRHRARTRLGGRSAHFKVSSIKGGSPCNLCQKAKEERKSRKKKAQQSSSQLSATLQSTQLDSLLTQSSEEEGEISRPPSPTHSHYSSSFHSESPQYSSDEDGGRIRGSSYSLSESEHSAVMNKTYDIDEGLNSGVDISTDPVLSAEEKDREETSSAGKDGEEMKLGGEDGEEEATTTEVQPELVTRGGVTIVYQVGPVHTSECGTQTDEHCAMQTNDYTTSTAPVCGTQASDLVPADAETQTNKKATGNTTEFGTQTDKHALPELETQTDEQLLASALEIDTHTEEQDAPKPAEQTDETDTPEQIDDQDALRPEKQLDKQAPETESTVPLDAAGNTAVLQTSTDDGDEKENGQIDTNPESAAEEEKANSEPLTINESEVESKRSAQLHKSQIQLGQEDDSTVQTTEDTASHTTDTCNTTNTNRVNESESNNRKPLQTAQENLSSKEENQNSPTTVDGNNDGKLSSISRSTLTDVSQRTSISLSSSLSPSLPPSGESSQTELADNVKQEEHEVATSDIQVQSTDRHKVIGGDEDLT